MEENGHRENSTDTRFEEQYVFPMPQIPFATTSDKPHTTAHVIEEVVMSDDILEESPVDMIRRNVFSITDPSSDDGELEEEDDTLMMNGTLKTRLKSTGVQALGEIYDSGLIDEQHFSFGEEGSSSYWDIVCLKGSQHKKSAWAGIPFRSPLFIYEMNGQLEVNKGSAVNNLDNHATGVRTLLGHTIIRCTSWQLTSIKLTLTVFRDLILTQYLGCARSIVDKIIAEGPWQFEKEYEIGDDNFKWKEFQVTVEHIRQCQNLCRKHPQQYGFFTILLDMEDRHQLTRFFFNDIITCLLDYYAERIVFALPWTQLERLYDRLTKNPFTLCFEQTIDVTTREKDLGGKKKKVPELTKDHYVKAVREFKPTTRKEWHMRAVQVYGEMRDQMEKGKHTYSTVNEICRSLTGLTAKEVDEVVNKLCDVQVLTRREKFIYLTTVHEWDLCVAYGLLNTLSNFLSRANSNTPSICLTKEDIDARIKILMETTQLCDEQLRAMRCFLSSPFTLIQGIAGSGKTSFIKEAIKQYDSDDQIVLTAFQGKNSGDLGAFVKGRAFTVHMLLYAHAATCECMKRGLKHGYVPPTPRTPAERAATSKKKLCEQLDWEYDVCIFENVKLVVFDEMSTMFTEIWAKLVCAMAHCGKLERIIMTGDINQLPSIQAGNLLRDLDIALTTFGSVCKFKHNHRVTEASKLLAHNSTCISQNNPNGIRFDGKIAVHIPLYEPDYKNTRIADEVLKVIRTYSLPASGTHIITRTNATCKVISEAVDRYRLSKDQPGVPFEWKGFHVGLEMMFKRNLYKLGPVLNNEILFLRAVTDEYRKTMDDGNIMEEIIKLKSTAAPMARKPAVGEEYERWLLCEPADQTRGKMPCKRIPWNKDTKRYARRACCTTVHAFQGGQIHTIIDAMPYPTKNFDTREAKYTTVTRGMCRWFSIGNRAWLDQAICQPEPARRTDLVEKILRIMPDELLDKLPGRQEHAARKKAKEAAEEAKLEELRLKHPANKRKAEQAKAVVPKSPEAVKKQKTETNKLSPLPPVNKRKAEEAKVVAPKSPEVVKKQKTETTKPSTSPIKFYSTSETYSEFSNFYPAPVYIDLKTWPTVEHYFQGKKFRNDFDYQETIREAKTPAAAKKLGRSRDHKIDPIWSVRRDDVMRLALNSKFTQHEDLKKLLLSTEERPLLEDSPDDYWGIGEKGTGRNRLGQLLMDARKAYRTGNKNWLWDDHGSTPVENYKLYKLQTTDSEGEDTIKSSEEEKEEEKEEEELTYEQLVSMGAIKNTDGYEGEQMYDD